MDDESLDRLWAINVKATLRLTRTAGHETRDMDVRCTVVCPGFGRTEMLSYTDKVTPAKMVRPETLVTMIRNTVELPNTAAVAGLLVNCRLEDTL
ncbi:Rossmann-fold NAD(P)-binding domain-containing protein [Pararhizobium mangrovi]|uniref:Short-chain dehydrogenase n=1 Tax=Pararhizobium mangrovi TaxID=2590452 RepID=A0A506U1D6_9HYPH|nr:hypothetical protein [Pararhizobium mangrovi]TPW28163.1 hypothetical protein FJU11_09890 [Pararhizobium mangrovi]